MNVGTDIESENSNWVFDEKVAPNFDKHVRESVPLYDYVQELAAKLSDWFVYDHATVVDLGAATGETMLKIRERHPRRSLKIKGYDNSLAMIEQAKVKGVEINYEDVSEVYYPKCAFAVSLFTLQFLRYSKRLKALRQLAKSLDDDGALFLVEKVFSPNPKMHDIFQSLYWDMKSEKGLGADEILNKANSLRGVMRPITVTENVEQLKKAGFKKIDVIFRRELFCGWLCMK